MRAISTGLVTMELIDIGCNLTHDSFDEDREKVLEDARQAGVRQFIVTGASIEGMQLAHELARAWPGELYSTAGVHPHRADTFTDETEDLIRKLVGFDEVVAVGEGVTCVDAYALNHPVIFAVTRRVGHFFNTREADVWIPTARSK